MNANEMSRKRKVFLSTAVVVLVSGLAVFGTFAAFTATTANSGNKIESGSVEISDSDGGSGKLYFAENQEPGAANGPAPKCIRVTYGGSLGAGVKLYASGLSSDAGKFRLKVERAYAGAGNGTPVSGSGPGTSMDCSGFVGKSETYFDGDLDTFPTTASAGLDGKAGGAAWANADYVDYKFTVYTNEAAVNTRKVKYDSGSDNTFTWEAINN